jgi:MFS superfamily sulfate permease-like transporter
MTFELPLSIRAGEISLYHDSIGAARTFTTKLLGIHFEKVSFVHNVIATVGHLPETSIWTLAVGLIMIAILLGLEHLVPRAPAPLIAVGVGIAGMSLLGLQAHGVSAVGLIPKGLPSFQLPNLSLAAQLWPGAMGIALMSFTESIAAGRAFAKPDEPTPSANRELLATGLANAGGAFTKYLQTHHGDTAKPSLSKKV